MKNKYKEKQKKQESQEKLFSPEILPPIPEKEYQELSKTIKKRIQFICEEYKARSLLLTENEAVSVKEG